MLGIHTASGIIANAFSVPCSTMFDKCQSMAAEQDGIIDGFPPFAEPIKLSNFYRLSSVTVCAGDGVFIPAGWWHCTINIDNSVALTQNVIRKENLKLSATVFSTVDARAADQLVLYSENLIAHQK